MRRSFSSGSHGINGTNAGGTKILRTVATSVTRKTTNTEPFSSNPPSSVTSTKTLSAQSVSSSSSSSTPRSLPISAVTNPIMNYYRPSFPSPPSSVSDEFEWIPEEGGAFGNEDEIIFGPPPSVDEVQAAVSSLQQVIDPASFSRLVQYGYSSNGDGSPSDRSSSGSEVDWIEPSLQMYRSGMMNLNYSESSRVFDAFRLLQTDAAIQRMVVSLSSDRAVWNAVLSNEVVRELRRSLDPGLSEASSIVRDSDGSCGATDFLTRIFETAKLKVVEIFDVINKIVNNLFKSLEPELPMFSNPLEDKLRQSVMLTVVVLFIVVVTRGNIA